MLSFQSKEKLLQIVNKSIVFNHIRTHTLRHLFVAHRNQCVSMCQHQHTISSTAHRSTSPIRHFYFTLSQPLAMSHTDVVQIALQVRSFYLILLFCFVFLLNNEYYMHMYMYINTIAIEYGKKQRTVFLLLYR